MKIEIEIDDVEILESYARSDGARDWAQTTSCWLYPNDIVAKIGGESAKQIRTTIEKLAGC